MNAGYEWANNESDGQQGYSVIAKALLLVMYITYWWLKMGLEVN
jgi:hypothetical protein